MFQELMDLDDEFRENHEDILLRFYQCFESVVRFAKELNEYFEKIKEGIFLQHTIEVTSPNFFLPKILS